MIDILNTALAVVSIALGLISWINPRYTLGALNLAMTHDTMGLSELRAASGAMFVGLGAGALILGGPTAYTMMGMGWGFASLGRLTSIILDGQSPKKWMFFIVEAVFAAVVLGINLS